MTEWDASCYSRLSGLQKAMADEVLALLLLKSDEQVLDIGCGDGKITAMIAKRVPLGRVIGVDPSRDMIDFATTHFGPAVNPNLHFETADARTLSFKKQFNLVVSFNALHWVPEQDAALRSIARAMNADGRAQLRLVTAGQRQSIESVVEEVRKSPPWNRHFRDFHDPYSRLTPEEYAQAAAKNGLRVLRIHTEAKNWNFKSRAAFFEFCSVGLIAWTKRLLQEERASFIDEVLDRYRSAVSETNEEPGIFKFYQTDVSLALA
jgi:trans-aconitate 2-methyltransferase